MDRKWLILFSIIAVPSVFLTIPAKAIEISPSKSLPYRQTLSQLIGDSVANGDLSPQIWAKYPLLKRICATESDDGPDSQPWQFDPGTNDPRWGWEASSTAPGGKIRVYRDVGACQINTIAHADELAHLHLDVIHSFADNVAYAKILFDREGWQPWAASKSHWDPDNLIR